MDTIFDSLIGNERAKSTLLKMIQGGKIPQSLLFVGPEGIGKGLFADRFARLLVNDPNGSSLHPDIHIYQPEGKLGLHSMEAMRQLSIDVYYPPYKAERKVFIIHDAERMLSYSANALLKTFEEPAPHAVMILLTKKAESLLPTVLSRCFSVRFGAIPSITMAEFIESQWKKDQKEAQAIASLSRGSLGRAHSLISQGENPARKPVLELLKKGRQLSYVELASISRTLSEELDNKQTVQSDEMRSALTAEYGEGLTSLLQQAIEKEIEGILALSFMEEAQAIFDTILAWYRDLQLLLTGGNPDLLMNSDMVEALEQAMQQGEAMPLEKVQQCLAEAQLALERSTPLAHCLETLFLKLIIRKK